MMIQIANPIYDSVFKYLMEDERIAKTLLSALLKKEVVAVEMRRNEYTNGVRDNISIAYDYDGNVVTDGIPDPFVESLIHDSIIVQIPLLHGQVNNRLEKVLSVFDQSQKNGSDRHVLNVNDSPFDDDDDMQYLLRRLLMAAANAQLRQEMNVEDEYFKALEDRDTALMIKDKKLAEQAEQLEQNKAQLRTMALLLSNSGMSVEEIAKSVGMSQDQVKLLLNK